MRIAQIAPLTESVPPTMYGGTERIVSYTTEALVELGHEVTLFATGDSTTRAQLEAVWPRALRRDPCIRDPIAPHMLMLERVRQLAGDFDVLHSHLHFYPFSIFKRQETPFVTTLHGRLDLPEHQSLYGAFEDLSLISLSNAQRRYLPNAHWVGNVPYGLPENLYRPYGGKPSYLAFLGRISPEKRVDRAIAIAAQCGLPIRIAAKVDLADKVYFDTEIAPLLRQPHVEYVGEIRDSQKAEFLSGAHALLCPIDWPEPFGLAMLEAMACGTPVIAFKRGAVAEVIDDGVTGFVVEDEIGAIAAVDRLENLSRPAIRRHFEQHYTARRMAGDYVDVYQRVLRAQRKSQLRLVTD
ncbi:glycosyltransferase family 4 protein [Robbsia sp. Bb-Pol-6]|uniref:Glycosyltransferase family 4 protein n=1 Tax=Robbsia betulipollinis TaxID=2981849 RepID=A0ABT3ZNJ4_9BURK|nr:glycosyltransferase family 4 protein [Robbsia betulipollinis]MCY0388109.1 glycosyltransferase family 4 protein [Robbsia betulipollinis]